MALSLATRQFLGKVVSVTGAGSGIAQATARTLWARGASLALCDNNSAALNETEKLLKAEGATTAESQRILTSVVAISKPSEVAAWVDKIVSTFGRLDHAANVAGVIHLPGSLEDKSDDEFNFVANINLRGTFNCMREQLKQLGRGSSIVNVSSGSLLKAEIGLGWVHTRRLKAVLTL